MNARALKSILVFASCLVLVACGDGSTAPPVPGILTVAFETPNSDDAAIRMRVTGPGMTAPALLTSSQQLFFRISAGTLNAAVVGALASGGLLSIQVPDVNQASAYEATIVEVADGENDLRSALSGYALTVER